MIDCENFDTSDPDVCAVSFGETAAPIVALGSKRVLAVVPDISGGGEFQVTIASRMRFKVNLYAFTIARETGQRCSSGRQSSL